MSRKELRQSVRQSEPGVWPFPDLAPEVRFHKASGLWYVQKMRGGRRRTMYLGSDPLEALRNYRARIDAFLAGESARVHTPPDGRMSVRYVVNCYLLDLEARHHRGEIGRPHLEQTLDLAAGIARFLGPEHNVAGLGPADFAALLASWSGLAPTTIKKRVDLVGSIIRFGEKNIPGFERPHTGTAFRAPPRRVLRRARNERRDEIFTAAEIRSMLAIADERMRAPILLAVNMGAGCADLAALRATDVDLERGIYSGYRHKTEARRYAVLWPETVEALRAYPDYPPAGPEEAALLLRNARGLALASGVNNSSIRTGFDRWIRKPLGLRLSFYRLKHTFVSVADEVGDDRAKKLITGHVDEDIIGHYSLGTIETRVRAITDHVRAWLDLGA